MRSPVRPLPPARPAALFRRPRGFSLVELLVVIGIIVVLIAVLLPTLARVREQAQVTACLSNVRQLGIAFNLYAADHRGKQPYAPPKYHHAGDMTFYLAGGPSPAFDFDKDGGSVTKDGYLPAPRNRVLNRYLGLKGRFDLFRCPSDQGMDLSDYWPAVSYPSMYETHGSSYLYNHYNRAWSKAVREDGFWMSTYYQPVSRFRPANLFVLFYEPPALIWPWGFPNNDGVGGKVFRWHRAGSKAGSRRFEEAGREPVYANVVYADGHAATVDFQPTLMRDETGMVIGQDRRPGPLAQWYLTVPGQTVGVAGTP